MAIIIFKTIVTGLLGCIIGSFLNVIILRMNTGKGIGGRSQCFSCNNVLKWYELIPVVSFLLQRGKCRSCHSRISYQYILVELITGLLFAGVAYTHHIMMYPVSFVLWLVLVSLGMIITVYDIYHQVIPEKPLLLLFTITLALGMHGWGLLLVPLPFFILWLISQGRWIGFGDIELMACAGVLLGITTGFSAVLISFWVACAIVVPWFVVQKMRNKNPTHRIPFGPFLLASMYIVGLFHWDILSMVVNMLR